LDLATAPRPENVWIQEHFIWGEHPIAPAWFSRLLFMRCEMSLELFRGFSPHKVNKNEIRHPAEEEKII
jgi:hypothetical protein